MLVFINVLVISGNKPWEVLSLHTLKSREKKVMKGSQGFGLSFCLQTEKGPGPGRVVCAQLGCAQLQVTD